MPTLVPIGFEDGTTVYVEAAESALVPGRTSPIEEAGAEEVAEKALVIGQELSGTVKDFCGRIVGSLRQLEESVRPTKATIQFGINISAQGNVYVVKGTGEASITITAEWG
jgi:hypothetical protein